MASFSSGNILRFYCRKIGYGPFPAILNMKFPSINSMQSGTPCNWCHTKHCRSISTVICSHRTSPFKRYEYLSFTSAYSPVDSNYHFQQTFNVSTAAERVKKVPLAKSSLPKRIRKKLMDDIDDSQVHKNVVAYAVGEELNLEALKLVIMAEDVYSVVKLPIDVTNAFMVTANYKVNGLSREAFFFSDGGIACWHMSETERQNLWQLARTHAMNPYDVNLIVKENEMLPVHYDSVSTKLVGDTVHLKVLPKGDDKDLSVEINTELKLHKYTFSNALTQSVNLAINEANLQTFIESLEPETQKLRQGVKSTLSKKEINMRLGAVFALRHEINLESGFIDVPDIYWDREELEVLYRAMITYLSMPKRVKVLNERLNYCSEILNLLGTQLNDQHHVRLEWIIIILILIEVIFECVHYAEKYGFVTIGDEYSDTLSYQRQYPDTIQNSTQNSIQNSTQNDSNILQTRNS